MFSRPFFVFHRTYSKKYASNYFEFLALYYLSSGRIRMPFIHNFFHDRINIHAKY